MQCEALEQRRLLSVDFSDGVLTVTGREGADRIHVFVQNDLAGSFTVVSVNRKRHSFHSLDRLPFDVRPRRIIIHSGGGNDSISVAQSFWSAETIVRAGAGHDTVRLGSADSFRATVFGGAGNDSIRLPGPWESKAVVNGGHGDDLIDVSPGNTLEPPETPGTVLRGQGGNDRIIGGTGPDLLDGGTGHDTLLGGMSNDVLRGGHGDDRLVGGDGKDHLNGGPGTDVHIQGNEPSAKKSRPTSALLASDDPDVLCP